MSKLDNIKIVIENAESAFISAIVEEYGSQVDEARLYELLEGCCETPAKKAPAESMQTFTLTLGDCAENHVGMQQIGGIGERGFSPVLLRNLEKRFKKLGARCELVDLTSFCPQEAEEANLLIVRKGVDILLGEGWADKFFEEQDALEKDTKAFMYGRVVNKKARYNLCFDEKGQEPDYENKKGRVVSFQEVPILQRFRKELPGIVGPRAENLRVEGNYYYDISICGIGFHGDGERKRVIGVRLGADMPLHYQWHQRGKAIGERIKLVMGHGDVYFMSEKTSGWDWKKKIFPTLRHAAGCEKFLK